MEKRKLVHLSVQRQVKCVLSKLFLLAGHLDLLVFAVNHGQQFFLSFPIGGWMCVNENFKQGHFGCISFLHHPNIAYICGMHKDLVAEEPLILDILLFCEELN